MRLCFYLGASRLALLSLALLCPAPHAAPAPPLAPDALLDEAELESLLLHLRAALGDPSPYWDPRLEEEQEEEQEEEAMPRAQRGDLGARLQSPFPGGFSVDSMSYQDGGDAEDGGKRNEALTSFAGGLQAVSREKGGFGFRFGRKRWSGRGWMH